MFTFRRETRGVPPQTGHGSLGEWSRTETSGTLVDRLGGRGWCLTEIIYLHFRVVSPRPERGR